MVTMYTVAVNMLTIYKTTQFTSTVKADVVSAWYEASLITALEITKINRLFDT